MKKFNISGILSKIKIQFVRNHTLYFSAPAPLNGHTAVFYNDYMYIYGGEKSPIENSSSFYRFNLLLFEWEYLLDILG